MPLGLTGGIGLLHRTNAVCVERYRRDQPKDDTVTVTLNW